jgi:hypothetical protein
MIAVAASKEAKQKEKHHSVSQNQSETIGE